MKRFVDKKLGIDRLKTSLTNAKIADKNNALYQTIFQLIDKLQEVDVDTNAKIQEAIAASSGSGGGGGSASLAENFITWSDETATLPNSRQLIAGTNISISTATPGQIEISAPGLTDHVVMSDGGIPNAQPLNNGNGQFLYTPYVP